MSFDAFGLSPVLLKSIQEVGFQNPTPIQTAVIPIALTGKDVIGLAQTGSGKTAAFCIPMAERLSHSRKTQRSPLAVVLSPTREIALQTKEVLDVFGKAHHLKTLSVIGGVNINPQIRDLEDGVDIVVATPGRLLDLWERRHVHFDHVSILVLDEADHMLDLGFLPQIQKILAQLPHERQTLMFSATMPPPIEELARYFLKNPDRVDIIPEGKAAKGITHQLYLVKNENKKPCLLALLREELGSTIVFTKTKVDANWIFRSLEKEGLLVAKIHSDCSQKERTEALLGFREGKFRILVATGIASRGIDVPMIGHVIHFDAPETVEDYIHRAGRTARGEAKGLVSLIATWEDKPMVREIEKTLGFELPRCTVSGVEPYVELKNVRPFGRRRR